MTVCVLFDLTWLPLLGVGRKSWYIIIIKFAFLNGTRLYLSHICYDVIRLWFSYIYYDGIRLRLIIYSINLWEAVFSSNQPLLDRPDSISPNLEYWQAKTQDSALYGTIQCYILKNYREVWSTLDALLSRVLSEYLGLPCRNLNILSRGRKITERRENLVFHS